MTLIYTPMISVGCQLGTTLNYEITIIPLRVREDVKLLFRATRAIRTPTIVRDKAKLWTYQGCRALRGIGKR